MKFKVLLLSTILLVLSSSLYASVTVDSIGVENLNGKKVILHKLDPKDNYYSIGRRYGVSPKVIQQFNNNASMQIGRIIKVPTQRSILETTAPPVQAQQTQNKPAVQPAVTTTQQAPAVNQPAAQQPPVNTAPQPATTQQAPAVSKPAAQQTQTNAAVQPGTTTQQAPADNKTVAQQPVTTPPPVKAIKQKTAQEVANSNAGGITTQQYKVSAGETLYAIAKRFGTTVEDITAINKLTSAIMPGQVLQVRTGVPAPAALPAFPADSTIAKRDSTYVAPDSLNRNIPTNRYGLFEKNEKGVATWIDDTSLDPNKMLILHRTAPIGTVMRITNPMNNRTTFAKVVGRFTDTESTKDAIIVMTKNVAQSLGALDKRFHVNISYGTPNE